MKVFIAGICGTFMAGIAQLAKSSGYEVQGCDDNVYPPMSTLLQSGKIKIFEGYDPALLDQPLISAGKVQIIIGNALSRGNPMIEDILNQNYPYYSGPQWLNENLLRIRKVVAVAGTHGKTSTSAMIAWIFHVCGKESGYLIGGKPGNFINSAEPGNSEWFIIEADEYDTAFFDKRSKFIHYNPYIALLNNLEFDHADIFDDLDQIKTQFHHLVRIIPSNGAVIANEDDNNIMEVLDMGCWSNIVPFSVQNRNCDWFAEQADPDYSSFNVLQNGTLAGNVKWQCIGRHNMINALSSICTANLAGINISEACAALASFKPTDRRLQLLFSEHDVYLYEDFAHHPTAIALTIDAIKSKYINHQIIAVVELRSNTMKRGCHGNLLGQAFNGTDATFIYQPQELGWQPESLNTSSKIDVFANKADLLNEIELRAVENSVIICMSNGSFDGIPESIRERLENILVKSNH